MNGAPEGFPGFQKEINGVNYQFDMIFRYTFDYAPRRIVATLTPTPPGAIAPIIQLEIISPPENGRSYRISPRSSIQDLDIADALYAHFAREDHKRDPDYQ